MKKVLLVGNGAREHAIAETLIRSPQKVELYAYMGKNNPGIAKLSKEFKLGDVKDAKEILAFAQEKDVDFAVIGPEDPLGAGVADALVNEGVGCVGPLQAVAKIETSKSFTRELLSKYNIKGNPKFKVFTSMQGVKEFLEELKGDFVIKADGLKGGKGVKVAGDHLNSVEEGLAYCEECINDSGKVIVEDKLEGQEFSFQFFVDGKHIAMMPVVQDHKRAFVGDKGPNTGGMGSYSCANHLLPFLTVGDIEKAYKITEKVVAALRQECKCNYKGILYGGFIVTRDGVRLVEYNARFGDPEAMNVLPILKTDFVKICEAMINGTLDTMEIDFAAKSTVCKYAVPEGYPDKPTGAGQRIDLSGVNEDAKIYFASVEDKEDGIYMSSSRAVAFVGIAVRPPEAEQIAQCAISNTKGPFFYRDDIGTQQLIDKRIQHMQELRG